MTELDRIRARAEGIIAAHLDRSWTFAFDRARTRAGLCDYGRRRISISALLAPGWSDAQLEQIVLHEVAHALAGKAAGHGPRWERTARGIGYTGGRTHSLPVATEQYRWVGQCPSGHTVYRFRRPTRGSSCARCSRRYDPRHVIEWRPLERV